MVELFRQQGVVFVNDLAEVPEEAHLLYSAHGVPPAVRQQTVERRLKTIDATCPLVTKVHLEAVRFAQRGYTIILIGHAGHDEVVGTMGESPQSIRLVQTVADVDRVEAPDPSKVAYLTQPPCRSRCDANHRAVAAAVPANCRSGVTTSAMRKTGRRRSVLAREANLVLVVGSQNSSNSRRLAS